MACSDAVEGGLFLRGLLVSMKLGRLVPEDECGRYMDFHGITDCKLYVRRCPAREDINGRSSMMPAAQTW